jgi:hypothetical protein
MLQAELHRAKTLSTLGSENLSIGVLDRLDITLMFLQVHQKITFHQYLIIQTLDIMIGMVMSDQKCNPIDDGFWKSQIGK